MRVKSFKDLVVWQKAMDLTEMVYSLTRVFPNEEVYALTNQIRRAVVSVPSNIGEGHSRQSTADYRRFLSIAQGSLAEVETQLLIASRLNYLTDEDLFPLSSLATEISKMLRALQSKLTPNP